ncbi:P-selectin [Chelonia mydas]|uniref:p-selectin n=1 Tax=Chelonia mydas TaxID=8469 RepID=M7BP83_CHEMY|nr:P-selectin [Chelonia mydas]
MTQMEVGAWTYHYGDKSDYSWEVARNFCRSFYTDLVAIQNQREIAYLNSVLPHHRTYYWIGIRKINNVWTWVGTSKALTKEAENWASREPNNKGRNQDCVEMYIKRDNDAGRWNDERCQKKKRALCYQVVRCKNLDPGPDCSHPLGEYSYNSTCKFLCQEGFELQGLDTLQCLESGNWTAEAPECAAVKCPVLDSPDRGQLNCTHRHGDFTYNSTCAFSCETGFVRNGSETLECTALGQWTEHPPRCEVMRCPKLRGLEPILMNCSHPLGSFSYGSVCRFRCTQGYFLNGTSRVRCQPDAHWSDKMPTCQESALFDELSDLVDTGEVQLDVDNEIYELDTILSDDPTSTIKSPMGTSAGLEATERGPDLEDEDIDEEVELDDDVQLPVGSPGGAGSQELFSTPEVSSQSRQLLSGEQEAGEETPDVLFRNTPHAPAECLRQIRKRPRCSKEDMFQEEDLDFSTSSQMFPLSLYSKRSGSQKDKKPTSSAAHQAVNSSVKTPKRSSQTTSKPSIQPKPLLLPAVPEVQASLGIQPKAIIIRTLPTLLPLTKQQPVVSIQPAPPKVASARCPRGNEQNSPVPGAMVCRSVRVSRTVWACAKRMPKSDLHSLCLWCLMDTHQKDRCKICRKFCPRTLKEREQRLKVILLEATVRPHSEPGSRDLTPTASSSTRSSLAPLASSAPRKNSSRDARHCHGSSLGPSDSSHCSHSPMPQNKRKPDNCSPLAKL